MLKRKVRYRNCQCMRGYIVSSIFHASSVNSDEKIMNPLNSANEVHPTVNANLLRSKG
jgi:hypothetical protein